jgi:hypothetical protein
MKKRKTGKSSPVKGKHAHVYIKVHNGHKCKKDKESDD